MYTLLYTLWYLLVVHIHLDQPDWIRLKIMLERHQSREIMGKIDIFIFCVRPCHSHSSQGNHLLIFFSGFMLNQDVSITGLHSHVIPFKHSV